MIRVATEKAESSWLGRRIAGLWVRPESLQAPEPIVLLHEALGSIGQWTKRRRDAGPIDVASELAAATGRAVLAFDRLGHGASDGFAAERHDAYLREEGARALPSILDGFGVERAVLLGHSDGGSIALVFAGHHPDRCIGLVSEAAHVIVEDITLAGIRQAEDVYARPDQRLAQGLAKYHGDKTDALFRAWSETWTRASFSDLDLCPDIEPATAPALIIQGVDDEYGSPEQVRLIAQHYGKAGGGGAQTWLVPDCRHIPHFEAHEIVLGRIAAFIKAL
ncbi:MAG: alpha/beta fold hydrolase [Magnetovibrionaceae bacterium]